MTVLFQSICPVFKLKPCTLMPVRAPDWVIVTTLAAMPALKSVVAGKVLNA
jgi:hypothetical protein